MADEVVVSNKILESDEGPDAYISSGTLLGGAVVDNQEVSIYKASNSYIVHIVDHHASLTKKVVIAGTKPADLIDDVVEALGFWSPALKAALRQASTDLHIKAAAFLHF